MKLFVGSLETLNWSFQSYGSTHREARITLRKAWQLHRRYTGATMTWKELWEGGDACVHKTYTGIPYRDNETML